MSLACADMNSVGTGSWKDCAVRTSSFFVAVSKDLRVSNASSFMSSSNGLVSSPLVASCDDSSVPWCLIPAQLTTSMSNSENRRRHITSSRLVKCDK